MALEQVTREFFPDDEASIEQILSDLLNNKNINMKTHILSPIEVAIFEAYIPQIKALTVCAKKQGFKKTTKFLEDFLAHYKEFMVSWKRLSREEVITALAEIRKDKTGRSFTEKLLGTGKNKE